MREYIVLRREAPSSTYGFASLAGGEEAAEPSLSLERLPAHALAELNAEPDVTLVAPKMPTHLIKPKTARPSQTAPCWGAEAVGATNSQYTGDGVSVAVLDTGIDASHPAFAGIELIEKDFSGSGNGDAQGHGTHCAGTIFGSGLGARIGVAPGVSRALIGKVLADDGKGSSEMVFDGMLWALDQRADIISLSLGFDFTGMVKLMAADGWPIQLATSNALETYRANLRMFDAIMAMTKARAAFGTSPLVIAAAGNESRRQTDPEYRIAASLPAAADDVLSVAAVGRDGAYFKVADFSNCHATLSAPGVGITSAWPGGGLKTLSGSSMACPHVAGVAALWWEAITASGKKANARNVRAKLIAHAKVDGFVVLDEVDVGQGVVVAP
ncbi:subtilisin-like protease [Pseudomonas sp. M47T1]|uniref:S8 family peptidase n=1 Tax=unclassified Pseudomonas TaxID=196821 RepID=UPI0002606E8E|nr:S8 family serine peptidase [Pseudomonas sp. M47T1]EIK98294.1 subtilisin-like protease [Pseudomonas sp. M47T1]